MTPRRCPKCANEDTRLIELVKFIAYRDGREVSFYACAVCGHDWQVASSAVH